MNLLLSKRQAALCALALIAAGGCSIANAATLTVNFPEINGSYNSSGFPLPSVTADTETFTVPSGQAIVGATFAGTWGSTSQLVGSTAEAQLFVNGVLVSDTATLSPDPYHNVVPFSYTFGAADLLSLSGGSASLSYIQTSEFVVRLSATTLTIDLAAVGVPDAGSSFALLGLGVGALALIRRKLQA